MISIVIPCLNEERYIRDCLQSVLSFDIPKEHEIEVLVLDGGSTDGTIAIIDELVQADPRIRRMHNPGKIQSSAMNIGISVARGEWIMRLDAHTKYPPDYVRLCLAASTATGAQNVGGVCVTLPGGTGYQAQIVQALTTHRFGVGGSGFRIGAKAGPADTVPFGFFRREVFEKVGTFDERLERAQDYELNRRIIASGGLVYLDPQIRPHYYNLPTLGSFLKKQMFRQGPYNTYMWYVAPHAFALRHAATGVFAVLFFAGALLSPVDPVFRMAFAAMMFVYMVLAVAASAQQAIRYRSWRHAFALPFCFLLFHLCHGMGMMLGILRLALRSAPVQRAWPRQTS